MTSATSPHASVSLLRRVIVWVIVVAFALAALGGIVVLLGAQLGETAGKVLGTTAIVGGFSVAVLCCASLLGRRLRVVGLAGVAVAILTLAWSLVLLWGWDDLEFPSAAWQILWTGLALTAAFSLASLLLLLADRRRAAVRIGLWVTLALFAVVLVVAIFTIWARDYDAELVSRIFGIAGILAALGAVVVPVMSLLLHDGGAPAAGAGTGPLPSDPDRFTESDVVARAIAARVEAAAAARGLTIEQFLAEVVDQPAR